MVHQIVSAFREINPITLKLNNRILWSQQVLIFHQTIAFGIVQYRGDGITDYLNCLMPWLLGIRSPASLRLSSTARNRPGIVGPDVFAMATGYVQHLVLVVEDMCFTVYLG